MKRYNVTGMSCAACSARVEKAVLKVEGVTSCAVSLLTNSMSVEGSADPDRIMAAVRAAGYGISEKGQKQAADEYDALKDRETPVLKRRLLCSLGFLAVLMYFSMGNMMLGLPLPHFFDGNPVAVGLVQLLLTAAVAVINGKFFVNGFKGLVHGAPNMDTLVALGSSAAFVYSTYALFAMTDAQAGGKAAEAMTYMHEMYFESSAMILTLITVGKMLEARSKGKTTDAIKSLMQLAPDTANIISDGKEVTVPAGSVKKGDIFVVRPGERIPVDGIVTEGSSAVDESALTGESIPADKVPGDTVSAATINRSGFIKCEASRVGEDTALSQIIKTVSEAAASKAPIAKTADKVSGIFVPVVICIALICTAVWLIAGRSFGFALARGISVLVISCPCALGLATPVAIMVGSGMGAKNGIMFKTAAALETAGRVRIAALDKTGTVTKGEPAVTDIVPADGISDEELLQSAYSLEKNSEHPLAWAVAEYAKQNGIQGFDVKDFKAHAGSGLSAEYNGGMLTGGSMKYISEKTDIPDKLVNKAEQLAEQGKTPLFFAFDKKLLGLIAAADAIKEDSAQAVKELRDMGIRVVMITGDNERTANAIAKQAGIDEVISGVMPEEKANAVNSLREQGTALMAGDGINDAPALTTADIGVAVGAGTDVAIDAADAVLMKNSLRDVPAAIRLGRAVLRNIKQNLFWAFFYNALGIPLAAGVLIPVMGRQLDPMFAAAAMSLSSFCVVSNALRLNMFKIYPDRDKTIKNKEENKMVKTIKIEGMMCGHCEAAVKKSLEAVENVSSAEVSHEKGTAVVTLAGEVADDVLKKAVEDKDYKVLSVE